MAAADLSRRSEDLAALLRDVVEPAVHPERIPLTVTARHLPGEPVPAAEAVAGPFVPMVVGDRWGGMWATTWMRMQGVVPAAWAGREVVALVHLGGARTVGFSAEGLIHDRDLRVVHGLHHEHREYRVLPAARGGEEVDFYVEAAANPIPRWHVRDWPRLDPDYSGPPLYALEQADLATVDREVEALVVDLEVAGSLARRLPARREELADAIDRACAVVAAGGASATSEARGELAAALARSGPAPSRRDAGERGRHLVTAVGHAHIDTAWLWPVRETRRKCARSFANQVALLDHYPEHHFVCSQAVQYQWVKEDHPELYRRIRELVAQGRWEPVGGMWVEADTTMPSGESLVRQFVHGKRFFRQEFGIESSEVWIPDVFGYSAALPQIARLAGVDALVTQKMSWNDTNRFPHSSFWWEGHDGSRILAHFPPADTYNGEATADELARDDENFRDAERSTHTLYPYGYGDGGGGPSARQLERLRRLADVDGLPKVSTGSVAGFLDELRAEADGLASWVGELYLEYHRATPTTHADVKLGNRRAEEALREAELWAAAAGQEVAAELDPLWKRLLLCQFHDIIPGSSIGWVYRDAAADHAAVLDGCAAVKDRARAALAGPGDAPVVFNAAAHDRCEVVEIPEPAGPADDGAAPAPALAVARVPGCGWAPLLPDSGSVAPVRAGPGFLDNGILRVEIDPDGLVRSVWDHRAGREVVAEGAAANLFQLHEDNPKAFDAWDVDREYLDHRVDLTGGVRSAEVVRADPLRGEIRIVRRFGPAGSTIDQIVRLDAGSPRVGFHTTVDWQERHHFLKVAFPVAVRSMRAAYQIQHGWIERPTVANTSWDEARFEVWAHRFADLSEPGYGVALLNDCKYGYDIRGSVIRLSLLRGPGYPDPDADRGTHRFSYALLPHTGDLREGRVFEEAEAFNLPLTVTTGSPGPARSFVGVDRPGVGVEAVKEADDGDGLIVRLCELHGSRGPVTVTLGREHGAVGRVDILERPLDDPCPVETLDGGSVRLQLRPFELVTLRFRPPGRA